MSTIAEYRPPPTVKRFHLSKAFVRLIIGPVGSGKSTGCCVEIMRRAREQKPDKFGRRKTRFIVIRNTYRELKDTTLATWLALFPEAQYGDYNHQDEAHRVQLLEADNTITDCEVLFRALDREADVAKLLSLELTGGYINEARETPRAILAALTTRIGRFPTIRDGGPTWSGVVLDTNPPDNEHWIYAAAEEKTPEGWEIFKQPGGRTPQAENLENLPPGYYARSAASMTDDEVRVYVDGEYGFTRDGKPIWPGYRDSVHCQPFEYVPAWETYVGIDFGLTPAAIIGQRNPQGRWFWRWELVAEDMGAARFASDVLKPFLIKNDIRPVKITGDPAGEQRAQTDETTPFQLLRANGIHAYPAHTNDFSVRVESVDNFLHKMIDGKPGLLIHPDLKVTRKGMAGGYCYKRLQVAGLERFQEKPDKTRYSHPCEAGQYMHLGAGEGRAVLRGHGANQLPRPAYSVM